MNLLKHDYINSLPQPFMAKFFGEVIKWPIHDICIDTGCLRIDVMGKLTARHVSDVDYFTDLEGNKHDADTFYNETN